jgi:hypothetical protein
MSSLRTGTLWKYKMKRSELHPMCNYFINLRNSLTHPGRRKTALRASFSLLFLACFVLLHASLWGQLQRIEGPQDFSEEHLNLHFGGASVGLAPKPGTDASHLFDRWGVTFQGMESIPQIGGIIFPSPILPPLIPALVNKPEDSADSSGRPLAINFRFPAKKIGFFLANGNGETVLTMSAINPMGSKLGSIVQSGFSGDEEYFIGFETASGESVSKVVIDYGQSPLEEVVIQILIDFVDPILFTTYLPQVSYGTLDNTRILQSIFTFSNLTDMSSTLKAEFFDSEGNALELELEEGFKGSELERELSPYEQLVMPTSITSQLLVIGYTRIKSNTPVRAALRYRLVNSGRTEREISIDAVIPRFHSTASIEQYSADIPIGPSPGPRGAPTTALAILNPSSELASVGIRFVNESESLYFSQLAIPPGNQRAFFIGELFPELVQTDLSGTLVFNSDQPVAPVSLLTNAGLPVASLSAGSTEKSF